MKNNLQKEEYKNQEKITWYNFKLENHKSRTEVDRIKKMFQGLQAQETDR